MTDTALELATPLLMPGIEDNRDDCLRRLEAALQDRQGISLSHLEPAQSPIQPRVRYDPSMVSADDHRNLPFTLRGARATLEIVGEKLLISFGVTAISIMLALSGLAGIRLAIVFLEGSTVVVVLNALRLLAYQAQG